MAFSDTDGGSIFVAFIDTDGGNSISEAFSDTDGGNSTSDFIDNVSGNSIFSTTDFLVAISSSFLKMMSQNKMAHSIWGIQINS